MTCDDSPCGGPDIEGMRRFLARRDRDRPDVFAGRGDVIEDLSEAMRLAADTGGAPGATRVVQGAPGAGKTALLKETLERIAPSAGAAGADTPLVLEIDPDTFASRTAVVAAVEAAMARREGAEVGEGVEGAEEVEEIAPTPHASENQAADGGGVRLRRARRGRPHPHPQLRGAGRTPSAPCANGTPTGARPSCCWWMRRRASSRTCMEVRIR